MIFMLRNHFWAHQLRLHHCQPHHGLLLLESRSQGWKLPSLTCHHPHHNTHHQHLRGPAPPSLKPPPLMLPCPVSRAAPVVMAAGAVTSRPVWQWVAMPSPRLILRSFYREGKTKKIIKTCNGMVLSVPIKRAPGFRQFDLLLNRHLPRPPLRFLKHTLTVSIVLSWLASSTFDNSLIPSSLRRRHLILTCRISFGCRNIPPHDKVPLSRTLRFLVSYNSFLYLAPAAALLVWPHRTLPGQTAAPSHLRASHPSPPHSSRHTNPHTYFALLFSPPHHPSFFLSTTNRLLS